MTSNNEYFKRIYETLSNQTVNTNHNDNYYLKQISLCLGNSYNSNKCNGKYLKDIAEQITGKTYEKIHFRNYYLREIVETVYQGSLTGNSDNLMFPPETEKYGVSVYPAPAENRQINHCRSSGKNGTGRLCIDEQKTDRSLSKTGRGYGTDFV